MSKVFYPSDEYDSRELEREASGSAKRRIGRWLAKPWRHDDDDDGDPPAAPAAARPPNPVPSLQGSPALAA